MRLFGYYRRSPATLASAKRSFSDLKKSRQCFTTVSKPTIELRSDDGEDRTFPVFYYVLRPVCAKYYWWWRTNAIKTTDSFDCGNRRGGPRFIFTPRKTRMQMPVLHANLVMRSLNRPAAADTVRMNRRCIAWTRETRIKRRGKKVSFLSDESSRPIGTVANVPGENRGEKTQRDKKKKWKKIPP